jgi:hypothetical protein
VLFRSLEHKELLLGVLLGQNVPARAFLRGLFRSKRLPDTLRGFFRRYGFSFLQNRSAPAAQPLPP